MLLYDNKVQILHVRKIGNKMIQPVNEVNESTILYEFDILAEQNLKQSGIQHCLQIINYDSFQYLKII